MFVALVAVAGLAAGCRGVGVNPTPTPAASPTPASPTLAPVAGPVRFHVQLDAGQVLTAQSPQANGCPGFDAVVSLGPDRYVRLFAYATSCDASGNARPGNGRHGVYRSVTDIPADRLTASVKTHTALGDAVIFTQPYYECTNSCHDYTEPVAVITLDHPVNPAYPALTAVSEQGALRLDQLQSLLGNQLRA